MSAGDVEQNGKKHPEKALTELLNAAHGSSSGHFGSWINLIYSDIKHMAIHRLAEGPQPLRSLTESPTAIAHVALMKLLEQRNAWQNRDQFFAVAATLVGYIVNDFRDKRGAAKRGGGDRGGNISAEALAPAVKHDAGVAGTMFDALDQLRIGCPRQAEVLTLHVLANNSLPQVAAMTGLAMATVERDLKFARLWMRDYLAEEPPAGAR